MPTLKAYLEGALAADGIAISDVHFVGFRDRSGELHELSPAAFGQAAAQVQVGEVPDDVRSRVLVSLTLPSGEDVVVEYRDGAWRRVRGPGSVPFLLTPAHLRGEA
jgi:hypothetical protein